MDTGLNILIIGIMFCLMFLFCVTSWLAYKWFRIAQLAGVRFLKELPDGRYVRRSFLGQFRKNILTHVECFGGPELVKTFVCLSSEDLPPIFSMKNGEVFKVIIDRDTIEDLRQS